MVEHTLEATQRAYLDNADYEETASTARAIAFVTACRRLLILQHAEASKGGSAAMSQKIAVEEIRPQMEFAQAWIAAKGDADSSSVVHPDFKDFRNGSTD